MVDVVEIYQIKELKIPNETHYFVEESGENGKILRNISKINIFIGANNSGKSKILRDILQNKVIFKPNFSSDNVNKIIIAFKAEMDAYYKQMGPNPEFANIFQKMTVPEFIDSSFDLKIPLSELGNTIRQYQSNTNTTLNGVYLSRIGNGLMPIFEKYERQITKELNGRYAQDVFIKIYVPVLRGLRPLSGSKENPSYDDFYKLRTIMDYFPSAYTPPDRQDSILINSGRERNIDQDEEFKIFTGLSAYDLIKKYLLGNLQERKLVSDYEEYLSNTFFEGKSVAIIPSEVTKILTLKIGDEKEQPIYNLGDGLQSIIISTMPLFLHRGERVLFFIDEPEKLIHPGLQRKFIETLLHQDGFESFQFFITTHSNHFLDITLDFPDISIFTFKKKFNDDQNEEKLPEFIIENVSFGDRSALELLGVRNSSIFLSNCTIWVEGITDRLYYRHYLQLYQATLREHNQEFKEFREDYHYSFVEFGGANITHFSFLSAEKMLINVERLCSRSFVITDHDIGSQSTRDALKEKLQDRCHILEGKEVENLLTKSVLINVIKEYEQSAPDITDFNERDYKNVYLGRFIEKKLRSKRRLGSYKQDSGTISDKMGFCRKALQYIVKWDDLSPEAKELTKKVYNHIKEQNS
jgi:predicted ATP-dependent endonuclease of OLD family